MMVHKYVAALLLIVFLSYPPVHANAEAVNRVETVKLNETLNNVQLIVTGDSSNEFDVDLEMPDGTKYAHDKFDGRKVFYLKLDNGRSWLINEAPAGEYKLSITGPEQNYKTSIQKELRKPETSWLSPAGTELTIANQPLDLAWTVSGDYTAGDSIRFYLQPAGGWQRMLIGQAPISSGKLSLGIPAGVADGDYDLSVEADNKTPDPQSIDPKVKLHIQRGVGYPGIQVTKTTSHGDSIDVQFTVPRNVSWTGVSASLSNGSGKPVLVKARKEDTIAVEQKNSTVDLFQWSIPLQEDGTYKGSLQLVFSNQIMGPLTTIPEFSIKKRDWSKDSVVWGIEPEKTNARQLQVTLKLQDDARVQVVDGKDILFDKDIPKTGDKDQVITVPLKEGDHIIEVLLGDRGGAVKSFSKRYLIDYTPPRLTMIQPQSTHEKLTGGYASGVTDKDSTILVGKKQIKPDENGYFKIDGVGKTLNLIVRDAHGNETSYHWSAAGGWNKATVTFSVINGFLVAGTAAAIFFIRRRRGNK